MLRVHYIIHESYESAGAIEEWVAARGHSASYSRVYEGDKLPSPVEDIDLLVVMGGPQSASTTKEECPYFDAEAEKKLIKTCVDAGKKVFCVCLGAQLLGEALGAKTEHSPSKEIGCFPVFFTKESLQDSCSRKPLVMGHWHSDMPGLTDDAVVLAYSEGCPRQIIRYKPNAYGFQCHCEFTKQTVLQMINQSPEEFTAENLQKNRFIQSPNEILNFDYSEMNAFLFGFLDDFIAQPSPF